MAKTSPFTSQSLRPQEECLLIEYPREKLFIGLPKENFYIEKRIGLTPEGVHTLVNNGHRVLLEKGAGEAATYSDLEYSKAGAEITSDTQKVFACDQIVKVAPPTIQEIEYMKPGSLLWSTIQLKTLNKDYFQKLQTKKVSALGIDYIKESDGTTPSSYALSEIAGISSILIGAELMATVHNGKGLLFGNITGVQPTEVVILGAGIVAEYAARTALSMGANVRIFDNSLTKLKRLQNNLPFRVSTSTLQEKALLKALMRCDIAIGAVRGKNRSPIIVTETMVENMKKGAVIIDVSIDNGGCFETSELTTHEQPTRIKNGVIHYGVPNITSRYSRTASMAINNILTPLLLDYADAGGIQNILNHHNTIYTGLYLYKGMVTHKAVADWFGLDFRDINLYSF